MSKGDAQVLGDEDVQWFVEQIREMFPESPELVRLWEALLSEDPKAVLRQIVSDA